MKEILKSKIKIVIFFILLILSSKELAGVCHKSCPNDPSTFVECGECCQYCKAWYDASANAVKCRAWGLNPACGCFITEYNVVECGGGTGDPIIGQSASPIYGNNGRVIIYDEGIHLVVSLNDTIYYYFWEDIRNLENYNRIKLGEGKHPCIAKEGEYIIIAWLSKDGNKIFASTNKNGWQNEIIYEGRNLTAPSIGLISQNLYLLTAEKSEEGFNIKLSIFDRNLQKLEDKLIKKVKLPELHSPSLCATHGNILAVFESEDGLCYYNFKENKTYKIPMTNENSKFPTISDYGENVYVWWIQNDSVGFIWKPFLQEHWEEPFFLLTKKCCKDFHSLRFLYSCGATALINGKNERANGRFDILGIQANIGKWIAKKWFIPYGIFHDRNYYEAAFCLLPEVHIKLKPSLGVPFPYELEQSAIIVLRAAPPGDILPIVKVAPERLPPLPDYIINAGEEEPSVYTLRREGYKKFLPYTLYDIDYDNEYLEYKISGLSKDKFYIAEFIFFYIDSLWQKMSEIIEGMENAKKSPWELDVYPVSWLKIEIDGKLKRGVKVPEGIPIGKIILLPKGLYKDGEIKITIKKIRAPYAFCSAIFVYKFDRIIGRNKNVQSQSEEIKFYLKCTSLIENLLRVYYKLPYDSYFVLSVYDVMGRKLRTLERGVKNEANIQKVIILIYPPVSIS